MVHFVDGEVAEGTTSGIDLERADFDLDFVGPRHNPRQAIIPLAAVKRVLVGREVVTDTPADDVLRKVALHFWDGEVARGLLRAVPRRGRFGMTLELLNPGADCAELYALPYHALKAVFFLRTWDTRPASAARRSGQERSIVPRQEAPLIELLSQIRGLRGLRHRGQISAVEYERRRSQVLERI